MSEQRLQFIQQNREKLQRDIYGAESRLTALQEQLENYREDIHAEKRVEARLELELSTAEDGLSRIRESHGAVKANLDVVVGEQQAVERQVFEYEKTRAINQNQIDNYLQQLKRNAQDVETRRQDMKDLTDRLDAINKKEEAAQATLSEAQQSEEHRQLKIKETEARMDDLNKRITKVNRTLDAKRNEYKLTKSMIESLEGFPESIRFLNSSKNWKGKGTLLSDVLYVNEENRVAIENYLEPYLNYYVVRDMNEAYAAIQLLGRSQKGKANFFVLDAFQDYQMPAQLLPPGVQLAMDVVEVDGPYRPLVAHLLENVLLMDSDDVKTAIPEGDWTVLARSGRFIRRRYSISGGSVGLFEGKKIGRKKNLDILEQAITKAEREDQKLSTAYYEEKTALQRLKQQNGQQAIQQAQQVLNQIAQQRVSLDTRMENFQAFVEEIGTKDTQLRASVEKLKAENAEIDAQLKGAERRWRKSKRKLRIPTGATVKSPSS
jgi:chromosome segregation protein